MGVTADRLLTEDGNVLTQESGGAFLIQEGDGPDRLGDAARLTQAGLELVVQPTGQNFRLSQVGLEVVVPLHAAHARLTQVGLEVAIPRIYTITVSPINAVTYLGASVQFHAAKIDQFGNPYPLRVAWSCDSAIGTIDVFGKFTAIATGSTDVTATEV